MKRLIFIRRGRELGFTFKEIRALLRLADERDQPCAEARDLAKGHHRNIRAKIGDLRTMEGVLQDMIKQCADGKLPDCPLIDALFGSHSS